MPCGCHSQDRAGVTKKQLLNSCATLVLTALLPFREHHRPPTLTVVTHSVCTAPQLQHSRSPNVRLGLNQAGVFQKTQELQIIALAEIAADDALKVDLDPVSIENQVWASPK
jgi:hypothetical protein